MIQARHIEHWVRGMLVAALAVLVAGCAEATPSQSEAFVEWASKHAAPLSRLDAPLEGSLAAMLDEGVGTARVVGIGESRHDTREQLLMKAALVRYLVESRGFRVLILEESFPHAYALDRYVTTGAGDPRDIMNNLAGWYLWDTEEMLEFVDWLRHFNESREPNQRVRVLGMDITAPAPGVRDVLAGLAAAGVPTQMDEKSLRLDLQQGDFWPSTSQRYASLAQAQRSELTRNYDALIARVEAEQAGIVAASGERTYERLRWLAEVGRRGHAFFCLPAVEEGGKIREAGQAQTVLWILEHEAPGEKAIVWAHNLHVSKHPFVMPELGEGVFEPMGVYLRETLGDDYRTVGAAFGQGTYAADLPPGPREFEKLGVDAMDGALSAVGQPMFVLDLRGVPNGSQAEAWLRSARRWRAQDADAALVPLEAFDLVYFVDVITRARPTPLALERYRSSGH